MIKIIIKHSVGIKGLPERIAEKIKEDLTFDNPIYASSLKNGRFIPQSMPPYIYMYNIQGNILYVPKGYTNNLLHRVGMEKYEIVDHTISPSMEDNTKTFTSTLRDYQAAAAADILPKRYGVLEASTGAGKTATGIYVILERKVKTLVIVHSKELLEQWKNAIQKHTNIEKVGAIGDSKFDIQDITIGIINSVSKHIDKLQGIFGQIIADECHRAVSYTWIKVLNSLNCKYMLGLSATPFRRDTFMTKGIYFMIGPKVHVVDKKHLTDTGAVLIPTVVRCYTQFSIDNERAEYADIISAMVEDNHRNKQIIERVVSDLLKYKEPIMVVSDRVAHCMTILEMLSRYSDIAKPVLLTGGQKSTYRKQAVKFIESGDYNVLISTTTLLSEGFDSPILNALFICTPIRFTGKLVQIGGRILRPSACQEIPRVYDFRDNNVPMLQRSGWARDSTYKKAGWTL